MHEDSKNSNSRGNDSVNVYRAYREGYDAAFFDARRHFWAEFMIKAGDMKMIYQQLRQSSGSDSIEADGFAMVEATYLNVADAILRGSREFPGYLEEGQHPFDSDSSEEGDCDHNDQDEDEHGMCSSNCTCN